MSDDTVRPATRVIHTGEGHWPGALPLTAPIYQTSTFLFPTAEALRQFQAGESDLFIYSRYGNPTVMAAEQKLAVLHGAEAALLFGSGMAAVSTTILGLASSGDEVLCSGAIYGNTMGFLTQVAARLGITVRFLSLEETREPSAAIGPRTRLLWFESPVNPTLRCVDIGAVARACRARGVLSIIDSTFASPVNQRPLEFGVDLVMESATKYLGGHSDVTAGMLAGPRSLLDPLRTTRRLLGTVIEAEPAWLLARSVKSVEVRVARHNANAQAVAEWLVDRLFFGVVAVGRLTELSPVQGSTVRLGKGPGLRSATTIAPRPGVPEERCDHLAIVMMSLPPEASAQLFKEFGPEMVHRITLAISRLPRITAEEQQAALDRVLEVTLDELEELARLQPAALALRLREYLEEGPA